MTVSNSNIPGAVVCLLCRGLFPCTRETTDKLHEHLMTEHNAFFYKELLVKLHLMDKALLDAIVEFPIVKPKSVAESVKALEKLMSENKYEEENDSFVSIESATVKVFSVNDNVYDDIEGSDIFYKEKDDNSKYTELENSHNQSIDDFIRTLPQDITYSSEFDLSATASLDETDDYITDSIKKLDNSKGDTIMTNLDEEESHKKKFKTKRVTCEICSKTLSIGSLKNHMRIMHFECDVCNDKFTSKIEVMKHRVKEHNKEDPKERHFKLSRVLSNNSSLDEASRDGISSSSMIDESSRDGAQNVLDVTMPNENSDEIGNFE